MREKSRINLSPEPFSYEKKIEQLFKSRLKSGGLLYHEDKSFRINSPESSYGNKWSNTEKVTWGQKSPTKPLI